MEPAAPETTREPNWGGVVSGLLLIALGIVWFLSAVDLYTPNWRILLSVALIAVGVASLALASSRRSADLIGIGTLLTVLVVLMSIGPAKLSWRVGEQDIRPTTAAEVAPSYSHGIGELTIDLRAVDLDRDLDLEASVAIGELTVQVPPGATVDVEARVGVGNATAGNHDADGFIARLDERLGGDDGPVVRLDLSAGIGQVRVER